MAGHWTNKEDISSVRAKRAVAYGDKLAEIVNRTTDESWEAMLPLVNTDRFVRRGNERDEELNWAGYCGLLDMWKGGSALYEKKLHRATEAANVVYLDLDERSVSTDGQESTLRSISIYEFDETDRIVSVDICMGFHRPR